MGGGRVEVLEAYVCWNFAMDMLISLAAAHACARARIGPCAAAAALGALYALAVRIWNWPASWPAAALMGALMALIAVRPDSASLALRAIGAFWAASLFCAGAQMLTAKLPGGALGGAVAGAGMCLWLARVRQMRLQTWDVQLFLRTSAGCVRFRALVDTGNRLHEPISGLPVMIVEEKALRRALPEGFNAASACKTLPPGWRMVAYGVLGSAGRMACFRPERLLVSYGGRWLLAPDIWIAVYPGRIPGQVAALAPTVIGTIRPAGMRHAGQRRWA